MKGGQDQWDGGWDEERICANHTCLNDERLMSRRPPPHVPPAPPVPPPVMLNTNTRFTYMAPAKAIRAAGPARPWPAAGVIDSPFVMCASSIETDAPLIEATAAETPATWPVKLVRLITPVAPPLTSTPAPRLPQVLNSKRASEISRCAPLQCTARGA